MTDVRWNSTVAVFIDADNVHTHIEQIIEFSTYWGSIVESRAYGDWRKPTLKTHIKSFEASKVECVQVDDVGKESTDRWLLLEIGKLLGNEDYVYSIDTFVIVSGDGGFASACQYIKDNGREVVVIGIESHTAKNINFQKSCSPIFYLYELDHSLEELKIQYPIPFDMVTKFYTPLIFAYGKCTGSNKGYLWVSLSQLGQALYEMYPDYKTQFGEYSLSVWLKNYTNEFLVENQMIRRIDPDPEFTRQQLLINAYIETQNDQGFAPLAVFGKKLREIARDYEEQFGEKRLSEWIRDYPNDFRIVDQFIIHASMVEYLDE